MTTRTRKPAKAKAPKVLTAFARYFVKATNAAVYTFRSSKSDDIYVTTTINGHATGCTCPARSTFKRHEVCTHMQHCEALEQARINAADKVAEKHDTTFEQKVNNASLTSNARTSTVAPVGTSSSEQRMARLGLLKRS